MRLTLPEITLAEKLRGGLKCEPLPRYLCSRCGSGLFDFDGYFDICGEQFCEDCAYRYFYRIF